MRFIKEKRT
jgi:hypothetical protein